MKTEVIKAYGHWPKGHIFTDMSPNMAATLIRRGLVREIKEPSLIDRVFEKSPVDRMMRARMKKAADA
jgi:hypothetical protein